MSLVLEETGVLKPSLSQLQPSTLLERVKKVRAKSRPSTLAPS